MTIRTLAFVAGLVFAAASPAMQAPTVDYSGHQTMETAEATISGMVYASGEKERREFNVEGRDMVMIIRRDQRVVWMLQPEQNAYLEMKIPEEGRDDDAMSMKVESTPMGQESVNGVRTTKNKVVVTSSRGQDMSGFMWTTPENILVKMDVVAVDEGSKVRLRQDITGLDVGRQDPALFEVPAGYTKIGMDLGGIGRMIRDAGAGADTDAAASSAADEAAADDADAGKKRRFRLKDVLELVK